MHYNFDTSLGEIIVDVRLENYRVYAKRFLYEIRVILGERTFAFHYNGSQGDFEIGIDRLTREQAKWALKEHLYMVLDGALEYDMYCSFKKLDKNSWNSGIRYSKVRSEFITVSSVFGSHGKSGPINIVLNDLS